MRTAPANPRILNPHELLVFTNLVPDLGSDRFFRERGFGIYLVLFRHAREDIDPEYES